MSSTENEELASKQLSRLKASRTAKKGIITKRIRQLETLVADGGSRRVIARLMEALQVVFNELIQVCDQISDLCEDFDELNSFELIRLNVETCLAEASSNLEERREDPPSSGSLASTWIRENFERNGSAG